VDTSIFVVSDLHLGGREGFRMCERQAQARLAELFGWIREQTSASRRGWIVIAGDVVDFLAEEPYAAITSDEKAATQKLERILGDSDAVWTALAAAAERCAVTLMLGNHDIELSLPKPRRRLLQRIGRPVEFLCDNEAFTFGALLVEHGNRYEGWNAVDHDALRRARSSLSRGEPSAPFPTQPGSELVVRVMNRFKQKYPWVDLLKPETAATIPILAALGGCTLTMAAEVAKAAAGAAWRERQFASDGVPTDLRFIGAGPSDGASTESRFAGAGFERRPVDELAEAFALIDGAPVPAADTKSDPRMVGEGAITLREELLFRGLHHWGEKDGRSFQVDRESERYLRPARALAARDHRKAIVFGHTHLAKRVPLDSKKRAPLDSKERVSLDSGPTYLNTGTWADLIRVPEAIFASDDRAARGAFGDFLTALKTDASDLRRLLPTFARIDFDGADNLTAADVFLFDEGGKTSPIATEEILRRME